jgi:hypothetical protein
MAAGAACDKALCDVQPSAPLSRSTSSHRLCPATLPAPKRSQQYRVLCALSQSARPQRRTRQGLAGRPFTRQRPCRQRRALRTEPVSAPAAPSAVAKLSTDDRAARDDGEVRGKAVSRPFARLRTRDQTNNRGDDHDRAERRRTAHSVSLSASGGRSNKDCFGSRLRPPHRPVRR